MIRLGISRNYEAELECKRWLSASGIVFILGDGDNKQHWVNAGRAYLRASLQLESLGLSQATNAAIVEASDFHEDIEALLGTDKRILAMIRFGKGKAKNKKYHSGRLPVDEIITSNQ